MMQKDIQDKYDDYQKREALLNDASKRAAQQEIQDLQAKARNMPREGSGACTSAREGVHTGER